MEKYRAMISHLGQGDWEEMDLSDAEKLVEQGIAYRCKQCDDKQEDGTYDDNLPSFHYIGEPE